MNNDSWPSALHELMGRKKNVSLSNVTLFVEPRQRVLWDEGIHPITLRCEEPCQDADEWINGVLPHRATA